MSEYLDRLKQRRDATPPPGNAPNVQSNVTFRKAIDYIERIELQNNYLVERLKFARQGFNTERKAFTSTITNLENQERYLLARLKEADEQVTTNAIQDRITRKSPLFILTDDGVTGD